MSDDDMIRRGDALKAIVDAMNVSCAKCGCPRNNHHYRHPFVPSTSTDPKEAIRAIPAANARETESQTVRAEALKEAAALFNNWWVCAPDGSNITEDVQAAILAIINKDKP